MLTRLRLENFKSWKDTGEIDLKPITGFFGPNSSGKTSLFQALLLMKQTDESPDRGIVFNFGNDKTSVNLGDFQSIIHGHDTNRPLRFSLGWKAKEAYRIPDSHPGSVVEEGDNIGFEVELREKIVGSEKSMVLEEMSYRVAGRQFGMRHIRDHTVYDLFAHGSDVDFLRLTGGGYRNLRPPVLFHGFPYGADRQSEGFFFNLQYGLTLLLRHLYYLGPLRAYPNRIYAWSGAQPTDMGPAGESAVDAILASRDSYERIKWDSPSRYFTVEECVAEWLKRLGLVHDFRVEALAEGRRIFEVKVRKSPDSAEALLSDVGFGVSQVLPVLALCFYVPSKSTLILEQPDIHLHPAVQAGLADVFIDAWKKRGAQIMFESHSEHLLRRLQRRIAEGGIRQDDIALFFCSSDGGSGSSLSRLEVDQFGNIANWPKDFFGDQFGEIAAMSEAALKRQGRSE